MWFTLVVDDGVKYIGKENAEHLMQALCKHYEVEEDWTGGLYCGIHLNWNHKESYVDTYMVKYTLKNLKKKADRLLVWSVSQGIRCRITKYNS